MSGRIWLLLVLLLPLQAAAIQPLASHRAAGPPGVGPGLGSAGKDTPTAQPQPAKLVIIIDDIGNRRREGEATIALPGKLSIAVLPHTPHGSELARLAHRAGKEVLLHAPMTALDRSPPGPGALYAEQSEAEFRATLQAALAQVPHARGVNNHMGSDLTRQQRPMVWLMTLLGERNLYFVDSRTHRETVAAQVAAELGLPHLSRQVFLDNTPEREAIAERFAALVRRARREGMAVAIGHPYPATIAYLREVLPALEQQGLQLVTVSEAIAANTALAPAHSGAAALGPPQPGAGPGAGSAPAQIQAPQWSPRRNGAEQPACAGPVSFLCVHGLVRVPQQRKLVVPIPRIQGDADAQ